MSNYSSTPKEAKRTLQFLLIFCFLAFIFSSCKKLPGNDEPVSQSIKDKIFSLGFSTENLQQLEEGYLVEGDIVISSSDLESNPQTQLLRIANNEQYRVTNILKGLPRMITISLSAKLPSIYGDALNEAIRRYNQEDLQLHFQRVNDRGDIEMIEGFGNFVGSSGLPQSDGSLYRTIKLNTVFIGNGSDDIFINYLATLMTHEIGHCIGFRHTDYMNRRFSCTGNSVNEGAGSSGVINIPGTPTGSDEGSWMLACIRANQNRPFNMNDKIALNYLY